MKKPTGRPNGKWLVTNPSTSPKNFLDGGGNKTYFDEVTDEPVQNTFIIGQF
jgi:alpha-L-fucosidase 2